MISATRFYSNDISKALSTARVRSRTPILERIFDFFGDYERAYLEVRETNRVAIHLYETFGFKIAHYRKSYYTNGEDALVMVKNRSIKHIRINDGLV